MEILASEENIAVFFLKNRNMDYDLLNNYVNAK